MKQKGQARAGLGAASMVLILLVLCLALLGVLALMTARADMRMSERDVQLARTYAQAAACVQEALAALDAQLADAWQATADEEQYAAACARILAAGDAQVVWLDKQMAHMTFDAGQEREISVEIRRSAWEGAAKSRFCITRHTLEDAAEWKQTDGLILMGL